MRAAIVRQNAPPVLRAVPPARTTADVIADLVAQNAELVARLDLLAQHVGRLDAEHAATMQRGDLIAQYVGQLEAQNAALLDRCDALAGYVGSLIAGGDVLAEFVGALVARAERPSPASEAPSTPRRRPG